RAVIDAAEKRVGAVELFSREAAPEELLHARLDIHLPEALRRVGGGGRGVEGGGVDQEGRGAKVRAHHHSPRLTPAVPATESAGGNNNNNINKNNASKGN